MQLVLKKIHVNSIDQISIVSRSILRFLLPKPIKILPDKILRELIVAFKANGYGSAVLWDIIGFKDIVPKA